MENNKILQKDGKYYIYQPCTCGGECIKCDGTGLIAFEISKETLELIIEESKKSDLEKIKDYQVKIYGEMLDEGFKNSIDVGAIEKCRKLSNQEAFSILEDVIDTLIEVGNGTTNEMLHEACDKLFKFRDEWFKNVKE